MIGNGNKAQVRLEVVKVDKKFPVIKWVRSTKLPSVDINKISNSSKTLDFEFQIENSVEPGQALFKFEAKPEFEIDSPIKYRLITDS